MRLKVFFLISSLCCLPLAHLSAQALMSYTLSGTVEGDIDKLYVTTDYRTLDTIFIQNGRFHYEGKTGQFVNYLSAMDGHLNQKFFVRQGENISLSYKKGDYLAMMHGSALNERYTGMYVPIADLQRNHDKVLNLSRIVIERCKDPDKKEELVLYYREKLHAIQYQQADVAKAYIQTHPSDELSLILLWEFCLQDWETLITLYDTLDEPAKQNPMHEEVRKVVNEKRVARLGTKVMTNKFVDANGKELRFSDWQGKYVLVDFWASWCGPCISELVYFKKIWEQLKGSDFVMVLISLDFNEQSWRKCFAEHCLPEWVQVVDLDKTIRKAFGVTGVPASFLINPSGEIIGRGYKMASIVEDVVQDIQKDKETGSGILIKGEWAPEMNLTKAIFRYRPSLLDMDEKVVWAKVDSTRHQYTAVIPIDHPVSLRGVFYTKDSEKAITKDIYAILGSNMFRHNNAKEMVYSNEVAPYYEQKRNQTAALEELVADGNRTDANQWLALNMITDQLTRKDLPADVFSRVLDKISAPINQHEDYQALKSYISGLSSSQVGSKLFDFAKPDSTGNIISVSDYRGKMLFIDFWASWCHFCREAIPHLKVLYEKYKDKGFEILGVSLDTDENQWKRAMRKDQPTWKNVIEKSGMKSDIATRLGIRTLPRTLLLNADGEIIAKDPSEQELEQIISNLS